MSLSSTRWHVIAESNFPWEREALDWLRAQLPDRDPWHVWTNFEFIDDEGKVNEVDALALTPAGLFLIEIKSRPGTVTGDAHTWTWRTDGRERSLDNPLLLTDRKAKRLASLLKRQPSISRARMRLPFVEPLVFLSSTGVNCRLQGQARAGVVLRGNPQAQDDDGIVAALRQGLRTSGLAPTDSHVYRPIAKALAEAGIRPSNKHRQVGDYQLGKLMADGPGYQEWEAHHVAVSDVRRRIRIYNLAAATSPAERQARLAQAQREFKILEGVDHTGILRCREYKDTEIGPALVFDHDPQAVRLDHLIREEGPRLNVSQKLQLVREMAQVLRYAHSRRLYHRALGPQSVLVRGVANGELRVQIMNWQTAARQAETGGTAGGAALRTTGTQHVEAYVENPGLVYLAPETARADAAHSAELDVFSLGCLTYLVFSGQPPADSALALDDKLRQGQGLRLSDVLDGCSPALHELVLYATNPEVVARYDTIQGFLDDLDRVEEELTAPDPEQTADPSVATVGQRLEGGFTVHRHLGRGSSSDALLVTADGASEPVVLKVGIDAAHNDKLLAEAEALSRLRHPNIVEYLGQRMVAGRVALLLRSAGERNLTQRLKTEGRPPLHMLQRYGEQLIDALRHMEDRGVIHRDIKPDNIGIDDQGKGKKISLVLFDFSLARTPPDNILAGTPPYLDPFLSTRPQPRWDLWAERFAAAMTLYEMAVGKPPVWGDGHTHPTMLDVEASVDADAFDPGVRSALAAFFAKALRRDFRQRHDNAEDMLRDWRGVFERSGEPGAAADADAFAAIAQTATPKTTLSELGYSLEAQDVLERLGIHDARELLAVDRIKFRYLKGIADKIRREIRTKAKELAKLRPDLAPPSGSVVDAPEAETDSAEASAAINEIAAALLPRRPAGDDREDEAALAWYLGLESAVPAGSWPAIGQVVTATGVDRGVFTAALLRSRERWLKNPALTEVRHQVVALLAAQGQVMTLRELALALLAVRGCAVQDDDERLRMAAAVARAALEAERQLEQPRFDAFDHDPQPLLASSAAWADYARQLGAAADRCARHTDPLLTPEQVREALDAVRPPPATDGTPAPLPPGRLLRLAASASRHAAVSSRQELYPRGMPALLALKHAIRALLGAAELKLYDLQDRVRGRYPEAEPLPGRPEADRLLEQVGAPLAWDQAAGNGFGAYRRQDLPAGPTAGTTARITRHSTASASALPESAAVQGARAMEERLQRSLQRGGMLVLTIEPTFAIKAEAELLHRFGSEAGRMPPLQRLSVDALLLRELRTQADSLGVAWAKVLQADAAESGSRDWRNLLQLVHRAVPAVRAALTGSSAPLLVVNAGLLARYELLDLLTEVEGAVGRRGCTPALWLLVPGHEPGVATIDGRTVPLVHAGCVLPLSLHWLQNLHRTAAAA